MNKSHIFFALFILFVSPSVSSYDLTLQEKEEALLIGGLTQSVKSMYLWANMCSAIDRMNQVKYMKAIDKSSIKRFSELFGFDDKVDESTKSPEGKLKKQGMTEATIKKWCEVTFFESLTELDKNYAHRYDEVATRLSESTVGFSQ